MAHIALARKWRPQRFEDVIGQKGVVETLKNAITSGRLAQSFIFGGPRGVGKTTTARILARALNCVHGPTGEPCGTCEACLEIADGRDVDVLEIDAATYTGIDAVRSVIIEPLSLAPMRDRYKIFIIDEVHRLSKQSFDALLKSIEEPPPYVKFMMATTDLGAVPATIQSRSQVFELKTLPSSSIREQLRRVAASESVEIEDAALALVARSAEGSMRDALSALDQVLAFTSERVSVADVSTVLGLVGRDLQFEIAETVAREDAGGIFALASSVVEAGFDLRVVCRELARLTRDLMLVRIDPSRLDDADICAEGEKARLQTLAEQFSREDLMRSFDLLGRAEYEIRQSSQPRHTFEMALLKWIHLRKLTPLSEMMEGRSPAASAAGSGVSPRSSVPGPRSSAVSPQSSVPGPRSAGPAPSASPKPPALESRSPAASAAGNTEPASVKASLLSAIRESNKMLYSMVVAQAQKVEIEGDSVVFTFAPVHKALRAQLEGKNARLVEQLAHSLTGRKMTVVSREGQPADPAPPKAGPVVSPADRKAELMGRAKAEPSVQNVLDVFGGEIEDVEEMEPRNSGTRTKD